MTMDETWMHHFTLESNQQSAEGTAAGESRPKQPKIQTSAGKVLGPVFWNVQGILFINYLEKGRTINRKYYRALLVHLKEEIAKKQPQMKKKKVLFHQDNALCHKLIAMMTKLHELHFKLLLHPPYSPNMIPAVTGCLHTTKVLGLTNKTTFPKSCFISKAQNLLSDVLVTFVVHTLLSLDLQCLDCMGKKEKINKKCEIIIWTFQLTVFPLT